MALFQVDEYFKVLTDGAGKTHELKPDLVYTLDNGGHVHFHGLHVSGAFRGRKEVAAVDVDGGYLASVDFSEQGMTLKHWTGRDCDILEEVMVGYPFAFTRTTGSCALTIYEMANGQ